MKHTNPTPETDLFKEDFAALMAEIPGASGAAEGSVVKGRVVAIENDLVIVDIGLKSEGRIPLKEFGPDTQEKQVSPGDWVDVCLERLEDQNGEVMLSREKARREEAWIRLDLMHREGKRVTGMITERVKGGFRVNLDGAMAFLPGSQVDTRPVRDITPLMGTEQPFEILKMDRSRGNIVVSRRTVLEESRAEARSELVAHLTEGQIVQGVVKNITDYGAFVDLGGVDGLLHVTDICWHKIDHPSRKLDIGQSVEVQVLRLDPVKNRISLGMKQLTDDPWTGLQERYPAGTKLSGKVSSVVDYGAFVMLEEGIEGLVHISEMSWTVRTGPASALVSAGQDVDVVVLDVDTTKRRVSLGMKQCVANPWKELADRHPAGSVMDVTVVRVNDNSLTVALPGGLSADVSGTDLSWDKPAHEMLRTFQPEQTLQVKVLDCAPDQERIILGVKQLSNDPFEAAMGKIQKGSAVTCVVTQVSDGGLEVMFGDDQVKGFIKKTELARERSEQKPGRFAVGEKVDAKITGIEPGSRQFMLSVKALEQEEHKKALEAFGSSDSGASLGDILGAAINQKKKEAEEAAARKAEKADAVSASVPEEEKKPARKTAAKKTTAS